MSAAEMVCPHCAASMEGDPIPEKYRQHGPEHDADVARAGRCFCFPYGDATHFRREIGVEVRGVYDGVLFWTCPDCGHAWPRFCGDDRLGVVSGRCAAEHNDRALSP